MSHVAEPRVNIKERLISGSAAVVRFTSISNIVSILILITGVEEAVNVVKMKRLAIAVLVFSLIIAGNSLTERLYAAV